MAPLNQQQRLNADRMIGNSFDAVGAPAKYLSPPTSVADMYKGIYPAAQTAQAGMMGRGQPPRLTALPAGIDDRLLAQGDIRLNAPPAPAMTTASVPLPRGRPGSAPSILDIAAMFANPAPEMAYAPAAPQPAAVSAIGAATAPTLAQQFGAPDAGHVPGKIRAPSQAAAWNLEERLGQSDWKDGAGGTFSPTIRDKHTGHHTGKSKSAAAAKKTKQIKASGGGRSYDLDLKRWVG